MAKVVMKAYLSPTLVLLALDWPDGGSRKDFLGFAVSREPGFRGEAKSWLPNRLGFDGPAPKGKDYPSETSPIQKFLWWDARIDDEDRGKEFTYWAAPVVGSRTSNEMLKDFAVTLQVKIPLPVEGRIGTYFNRAVVSSQAFSKKFGGQLAGARLGEALAWLGNGMEAAIPEFLGASPKIEGAIYHLTDDRWVIPALKGYSKENASLVYNRTTRDDTNAPAVAALKSAVEFHPRTKAKIMHNKFLVHLENGSAKGVLMGSANFTTGGLTTQANLIHTFDSPKLAALYLARKRLLQGDPALAKTANESGWSDPVKVDEARIRVFFPPEPKGERNSIKEIVTAVKNAKKSVLFCVFSPTDRELRQEIFKAGDRGLMMFGLVNTISRKKPEGQPRTATEEVRVDLYHRSRKNKDFFSHSLFPKEGNPDGFWWERAMLPGDTSKFPVFIHHKFVVTDAETDNPTIYTGSANMSAAALYNNDENLIEIKGSPRIAAIYLAEFLRLYEHYRARATWNNRERPRGDKSTYRLAKDSSWARKAYTSETPEFKCRVNMVG
ncbi:MAG: phospholipase D-like domain-containing protein [bacterium]|nr:phospholipase D-like domain-containing protein [bacterium]